MLSVIIPAYNEEKTLAQVIDRVVALPLRPQVIVVSDGSTDGTNAIVRDYGSRGTMPARALRFSLGSFTQPSRTQSSRMPIWNTPRSSSRCC